MPPAELTDGDRRGAVIVLRDLHKRHANTIALRGLSLTVPQGAIFALLGPNGCGKTTTLKLLLGMARADSGSGTVFGLSIDDERDSVAIRARTGFVSETKELFQQVDVATTIRLVKSFYPRWDDALAHRLLREFALIPAQKVSALSKGMRAKLALLVACCRGADLLVLDEPTDGLDPAAAEQMLESLVGMVAETGLTVLLSSHHLHEVERVADGAAIMRDGRVVLRGELDELRMRVRRIDVRHVDARQSDARDVEAGHAESPHAESRQADARVVDAQTHAAGASDSWKNDAGFEPTIPDGTELLHSARTKTGHTLLVRGDADGVARQFAHTGADISVHAVPLRELFLTMTTAR